MFPGQSDLESFKIVHIFVGFSVSERFDLMVSFATITSVYSLYMLGTAKSVPLKEGTQKRGLAVKSLKKFIRNPRGKTDLGLQTWQVRLWSELCKLDSSPSPSFHSNFKIL